MSRTNSEKDIEFLIDLTRLIDKYGAERIDRVIVLLKNSFLREELVGLLESARKVAKVKRRPSAIETHNEITNTDDMYKFNHITRLLMDKNLFRNIQSLEEFFRTYHFNSRPFKSREDKIYNFTNFIISDPLIEYESLVQDILDFSKKYELRYHSSPNNDLSKWSDLIIKKK